MCVNSSINHELLNKYICMWRSKMKKTPLGRIQEKKDGFNFYSFMLGLIQHYNGKGYWKMREEVVNPNSKKKHTCSSLVFI